VRFSRCIFVIIVVYRIFRAYKNIKHDKVCHFSRTLFDLMGYNLIIKIYLFIGFFSCSCVTSMVNKCDDRVLMTQLSSYEVGGMLEHLTT